MNNNHTDERMQKCREYIEALEEERRKIQVFERELPLCLELVTQAIGACRQQLAGTTTESGQHSECSEQTSTDDGPVLEEFIPIKKTISCDEDEEDEKSHQPNNIDGNCSNKNRDNKKISDNSLTKSDWLQSVQLWDQTPNPTTKEDSSRKVLVTEVQRNGGGGGDGAEKSSGIAPELMGSSPSSAMSSAERGRGSDGGSGDETRREEKGGHSQKKARRRRWLPELHRRFLHALQQLGGSQVATPKQIRELMKVDGLTSDEVKSHLQKFRLHTRRPSPSIHNHPQAPQFVVVGGIWIPPPEYTAVATPALPPSQAPASIPQMLQCKQLHSAGIYEQP
ncbi:transcription factor HHO3-like [Cornus florida]|uniref:transcription factor HHO3-like n=1 Tax=Cornus florida TaxID=4283 RepID=UPI00289A39DC|nr:transcription factor HHO3-like [Cornus florida]